MDLVQSISAAGFHPNLPGPVQGALNSIPVNTLRSDPSTGIAQMSEAGIQGIMNNIPVLGMASNAINDAIGLYDDLFGEDEEFETPKIAPYNNPDGRTLTKDEKKVPAKLFTRSNIKNDNSITSYGHLWSMNLTKLGKYSIQSPFKQEHNKFKGDDGLVLPHSLLPATAFRYDTYKANTESIQILGDLGINIPFGYSLNKSISVTLFNDCQDVVRRYIREYRQSVNPTYRSTRPYKDCCSKLGLFIYNKQLTLMYKYFLYVIPDLSDEGISDQGNKSFDLSFNILGEFDNNEGK